MMLKVIQWKRSHYTEDWSGGESAWRIGTRGNTDKMRCVDPQGETSEWTGRKAETHDETGCIGVREEKRIRLDRRVERIAVL